MFVNCQLSTVKIELSTVNCSKRQLFLTERTPHKIHQLKFQDYTTSQSQRRIKFQKQLYQSHVFYKPATTTTKKLKAAVRWHALALPIASTNLSHLSAKLWCVSLALHKKVFDASELISMLFHERFTTGCWAGAYQRRHCRPCAI